MTVNTQKSRPGSVVAAAFALMEREQRAAKKAAKAKPAEVVPPQIEKKAARPAKRKQP